MIIIVPIIVVVTTIFAIAMITSQKIRGKMMSCQVKTAKYLMYESKEDIKSISDNMVYATKYDIKTTARSIKEGFTEENIFCINCGNEIDGDSKLCKKVVKNKNLFFLFYKI